MQKEKYKLIFVFLLVFISMIAIGLSKPALTFKVKSLEMGGKLVGLKVGLLTSFFMIFRAMGSAISTKVRRRRIVVFVGFSIFGICFMLYNLFSSYILILIIKPVEGILAGLTWPLVQLLVGVVSPQEWVVTSITVYFAIGKLGGQVGNVFYGFLNSKSLSLEIASFLMFLSAILALGIYSDEVKKIKKKPVKGEELPLRVVYLSAITAGINLGLMMEVTLYYLNVAKQLSESQASIVYGVVGLATIAVPIIQGYIADKLSGRIVVFFSSLLIFFGGFFFSLESIKGVISGIPLVLYCAGVTSLQSLSRGLALRAKEKQKAIGYTNALGNIGAALSPIIGGMLFPFKLLFFDSAFLIVGILSAIFLLMFLVKA